MTQYASLRGKKNASALSRAKKRREDEAEFRRVRARIAEDPSYLRVLREKTRKTLSDWEAQRTQLLADQRRRLETLRTKEGLSKGAFDRRVKIALGRVRTLQRGRYKVLERLPGGGERGITLRIPEGALRDPVMAVLFETGDQMRVLDASKAVLNTRNSLLSRLERER